MKKIAISALFLIFVSSNVAYADQVGTMAPAMTLMDLDGRIVKVDHFKGKVMFLDFWAPWCIPCKEELPELDRLYKKYKDEGLIVIGISVHASARDVALMFKRAPVAFSVFVDSTGDANDAYLVSGIPTAFLIGKDGVIRHRHTGFVKELLPLYEKEIADLLKQD
jgi:thiol-disulfide isomerase/thioredoxin